MHVCLRVYIHTLSHIHILHHSSPKGELLRHSHTTSLFTKGRAPQIFTYYITLHQRESSSDIHILHYSSPKGELLKHLHATSLFTKGRAPHTNAVADLFPSQVPPLWNKLPVTIKNFISLCQFKSLLI